MARYESLEEALANPADVTVLDLSEEELEELSVQNRETNQPTMTLVYLTTNYKAEIGQLTNLQRLDLSYSDYFDYY
ncbi:hypothetical protein CMK14_04660 [Candidatus Poribacteria bacterium]|nr:hypothetical protein [Candidatus Poribacteria bacterium]